MCVPALREVERDFGEELAVALRSVAWSRTLVVLTTGTGLERVLRVATSQGQSDALRAGLGQATVVCRGPKPVAVLKREGLPVHVRAESPHTTSELLAALSAIPVEGRAAIVVQDGGPYRAVAESLAARGARLFEVRPYEWALPEDLEPLRGLVRFHHRRCWRDSMRWR